jgi:hypothetical protein
MHTARHQNEPAAEEKQAGKLLGIVREATERFRDVAVAEKQGYVLQFGCVSGSDPAPWAFIL